MLSIISITALWLRFKSMVYLAGGIAVWTLMVYAYAGTKAKMAERARCNAAALAMELKQANADLVIARATAKSVQEKNHELNTVVIPPLQEKAEKYDLAVSKQVGKASCTYDAGDVRSLRAIGPRKAQPKRTN